MFVGLNVHEKNVKVAAGNEDGMMENRGK